MTNIHHHPEDASLTSYAAGALPAALALVVGCHLEYCPRCRSRVSRAEDIGGALIDELPPEPLSARARADMLARLDQEPGTPAAATRPAPGTSNPGLPAKLQRLLGETPIDQQSWRKAGPGVRLLSLDCDEGNSLLLDIAPGRAVPVHSHRGTELTLILNGEYTDKLGRFAGGDVADLDDQTEHQPVAGPQGCLCLAGLDAPLRYKAWVPRLLQPFFGL